jgi:hypothetical protein
LKVFYDPEHPEVNTPLEPDKAYDRERGFYIPIWLVFILALPAYLLAEFFKARRKGVSA